MKTEAYEFLKAGRVDRFDMLFHWHQDRAQEELPALGEVARALAIGHKVEPKYNHRCMGFDQQSDKRLYSFETWGELSDAMAKTADADWWRELQRLDFRIECDVDSAKLPGYYVYLQQHRARGRNVNSFDSREREKKEGRHAGGQGVVLGSHKSDRRLSVYKRKGEKGAIELQLSGRALRELVGNVLGAFGADPSLGSIYARMMEHCRAALEKMAREAGFESAHALVLSVGPDADLTPPPDFVAEAPVEMLVQSFMNLDAGDRAKALSRVLTVQAENV